MMVFFISGWPMIAFDTGVSLCTLISNHMHLVQVFQVEGDLKIVWKISQHVTCDASNNK